MRKAGTLGCLIFIGQCGSIGQTPNAANRATSTMVYPAAVSPVPDQRALAPLTEHERLRLYLRSFVEPVSLLSNAASAGIGQWRGTPAEWKKGDDGYARRFGSAYAQHAVSSTLLFVGSGLFHEDNRYVPSGQSGVGRRAAYALESTFLAWPDESRSDSGRRLSISRIGAFVGTAFISRAWQPRSSRSLHSAEISLGTAIGVSMGFNVAREFLHFKSSGDFLEIK
jgi:hypothetical protein